VLILRLIGMTIGLSTLTTWGVTRFDDLSRTVTLDQMTADFVAGISSQVMDEIFLLAASLCALALVPTFFLRRARVLTRAVHSWW